MENIETQHLILKKLHGTSEAKRCYDNFLSSYKTAKYMLWKPTDTVKEAEEKLAKWTEYSKDHMLWFIYEKETDEPIGFFSMEDLGNDKYGSMGLCFGEKYVGKGYGFELMTKVLSALKDQGAKQVEYSHIEGNIPSQKLALKLGFQFTHKEKRIRKYDQKEFDELFYELEL